MCSTTSRTPSPEPAAMAVALTPEQVLTLRALAAELAAAPQGGKAALKARAARDLAVSVGTLHRYLAQVGYSDGRKPRSDRGRSVVNDADALMIATALNATVRANGRRNLCLADAQEIMHANGQLAGRVDEETGEIRTVSTSTLSRALRRRGLHPDQVAAPAPHMPMRYPHPNHTWEIDASVATIFYLANGRAQLLDESKYYKNKPEHLEAIAQQRVIRHVCWDGCSGAVLVRYYPGAESSENVLDFMIWCMTQRTHRGQPMPVYGAPFGFYLDQGSAHRSALVRALCDALEIELVFHAPGNPRATGGAESSQRVVENKFEAKLAFVETRSLDELNARAEQWMHAFNARATHTRHGHTRYGVWSAIRAEHLRIPPAEEILRALPTSKIESRRVEGDLSIGYAPARLKGARYTVAGVPGVYVGATVEVALNPYERNADGVQFIRVRLPETGELTWTSCPPLVMGLDGVRLDAPVAREGFNPHADTLVDGARKGMARTAYGTDTLREAKRRKYDKTPAFLGALDPFAPEARVALPSFMPRRGTELNVPSTVQIEVRPLSLIEAMRHAKARLGRPLTPDENAWVRSTWPDGVPETELDLLLNQINQLGEQEKEQPIAAAGGLRLV